MLDRGARGTVLNETGRSLGLCVRCGLPAVKSQTPPLFWTLRSYTTRPPRPLEAHREREPAAIAFILGAGNVAETGPTYHTFTVHLPHQFPVLPSGFECACSFRLVQPRLLQPGPCRFPDWSLATRGVSRASRPKGANCRRVQRRIAIQRRLFVRLRQVSDQRQ